MFLNTCKKRTHFRRSGKWLRTLSVIPWLTMMKRNTDEYLKGRVGVPFGLEKFAVKSRLVCETGRPDGPRAGYQLLALRLKSIVLFYW